MKKNINIIISGGGTGGHLFPAIAIAQTLKKINESINILFVGAKGKIEEKKVPELGFSIELLNISGFARKLSIKNITFFFKLFSSLIKSAKIIKRFKPDIAVGVGGYASGPLLHVAAKKGIPTLIQEQNSYPGITNKLLSKRAKKICVAYKGTERFFPADKIILTGNPVRDTLLRANETREKAAKYFGLDPKKKIILSVGGSGGARTINNSIVNSIDKFENENIQLLWQTGKYYYEDSLEIVQRKANENIKVKDFITRMDLAFKAADIVISRAGAGTISELCLLKKACILVPSPNVAEDHQTKNAQALTNTGAAILIKDSEANQKLIDTALNLIQNKKKLEELTKNIEKHAVRNSAMIIAQEILKLIK